MGSDGVIGFIINKGQEDGPCGASSCPCAYDAARVPTTTPHQAVDRRGQAKRTDQGRGDQSVP